MTFSLSLFPHEWCASPGNGECIAEASWNRFASMVNAIVPFTVETVLIVAGVYVAIMAGYTAGVIVWRLSQWLQNRAIAKSAHNALHAALRRQRS